MKNILFTTLVLTSLFVNSCGTGGKDLAPPSKDRVIDEMPSWMYINPVEDGKIFDSATEVSQDLQMAFDKAEMKASKNMAGKMESKMRAATSRVQEELGFGDDSQMTDTFTNTMEQLVNKSLNGVRVVEKKPVREGNLWRAYVLISYDAADAAEQIMNEMKKNEAIQKRKAHKAELEDMRKILDEAFSD